MLSQYNQRIKDQLQADVIEKLEQPEVGQVHYLPHRPVIRNDKQTSKVRIVCDASSKIGNSQSLSDCLLPGPSLTESLFSVSIQFRLHRYAFSADIEKAFLQIMLDESHRDFVRFLYFKDLDDLCSAKIKDPENIAIYRVSRVLFGLSSSPFLLSGTLTLTLPSIQNCFAFYQIFTRRLSNFWRRSVTRS